VSGSSSQGTRHLVLVLGDQLDHRSSAFDGFDVDRDAVWMAEVAREVEGAHQRRIAVFFAAMRHFRDELRDKHGRRVLYTEMPSAPSKDRGASFAEVLGKDVRKEKPERLILVEPGDYRVLDELRGAAEELGVPLEVRVDRHFYETLDGFRDWAEGKKELVLEHFYRKLRKREDILVDEEGKPEGDRWNYDADNRETFGKNGPGDLPHVRRFRPDEVTEGVLDLVQRRFGTHPGSLESFDLPVNHEEARAFLRDFIKHRLPLFGKYEDAMWEGETFLYHSRLSVMLNLKLLDPRECVGLALNAYADGHAPIAAVEGFVRQILGWREFIRGVYWTFMPDYIDKNALGCDLERDVPSFFWDGDTDMKCVSDAMGSVVRHGYAHHIQRLMVLGLFSQMLGVHPRRFHDWHMAMYLDAVDWVSLPNALGMSQYGDGGIVGTKPYCATGKYVDRMSNHCKGCRYDPKQAEGDRACPFTTLYWDFLARHRQRFDGNQRMNFQVKNVDRKDPDQLTRIRKHAAALRDRIDAGERV
jgi:deoxyribodipyrimidine photolyase-related protein